MSLKKQQRQKLKDELRIFQERCRTWGSILITAFIFISIGMVMGLNLPMNVMCPSERSICYQFRFWERMSAEDLD